MRARGLVAGFDRVRGPPSGRVPLSRPLRFGRLDQYLVARALPPMTAVLTATTIAFLCERLLRSFDLLSRSSRGGQFLVELALNLTPHYVGLTLPIGFFVSLFVVINRLNADAEVDAMLASGVSLSRIAAPFVGLGVLLMVFSLALYGFVQPYTRYGYRVVLHAAENAGWNGEVMPQAVYSPSPSLFLTADSADPTGRTLGRILIRRLGPGGREDVLTAQSANVRRNHDEKSVTLELQNGQQLSTSLKGNSQLLSFRLLTVRLPLVPAARLMRARGGQETELTLVELAKQGYQRDPPVLPRQVLLAELYSRLAKAFALPLMPLIAVPFGLTAKRAGTTPAMLVAGLILFTFQTSLLLTQGMVSAGGVSAALAQGVPTLIFAAICLGTFLSSRERPGENPVNWLAETVADVITSLRGRKI